MNVQWRFGGAHPITEEFLGCVTTDSPEEFKAWLVSMCPTARVVIEYERTPDAVRIEGGYSHRINFKTHKKNEQMIFKLTYWDAK